MNTYGSDMLLDSIRLPKLLVVDDQPINIRILTEIFEDDHEVFMATDGLEALQVCSAHRPDLILLDVMMPGMDGHEVCRRLKGDASTADIPVIFVTTQSNPDDEAIGLQLGAADFISKPVNSVVVRARVKTQLLLHELKQNLERKVAERTADLQAALTRFQESKK